MFLMKRIIKKVQLEEKKHKGVFPKVLLNIKSGQHYNHKCNHHNLSQAHCFDADFSSSLFLHLAFI